MLWQICIGVSAAAFLVVSFYLVRLLRTAQSKLERADQALHEMERHLAQTTTESMQLIRLSTTLLEDLQGKLQATDRFFDAVEETGETVNRVSQSVQLLSQTVTDTVLEARRSVHNGQRTVNDLMELTTTGMQLWNRLQSYRQAKAADKMRSEADQQKRSEEA
ncbi:DUF948 domain-containing protein [Paenibacillus sp. GD4]|uniref:DUF948 domain-containing protein n=1 Tax=Paenibacillus sp. GD4 TaxID=3068890 RepID=UPI0027967D06|nr:DUF948 domain-containing protein [Paenibacillus sp. GD4]MDQ1909869.1 DUF948 domain-containing protein [Paenibacillus sp. GD4]